MSIVFRKTKKDYYVISPVGLIAPVSFVTKSDMELKRAKLIYNIFLVIVVGIAASRFSVSNGGLSSSNPVFYVKLFPAIFFALYFTLAFSFSTTEIYRSKAHGEILED